MSEFDDVTIHHDSDAPAELGAYAYATGSDIQFAGEPLGDDLLAHEASHAVQQDAGVAGDGYEEAEVEIDGV